MEEGILEVDRSVIDWKMKERSREGVKVWKRGRGRLLAFVFVRWFARLSLPEAVSTCSRWGVDYDDANALNTLRQTANPGFWWYISSHLHGTASPSGSATKTPGPSSMPMSMPMSIPMSMPISMPMSMPMPMPMPMSMPMPGRMRVPGPVSVSDAADIDVVQRSSTPIASSSGVSPASEPSEFSEPIEPVEQSPPRGVSSGSGAGLSSKTINRFLRGKLLRLPIGIPSRKLLDYGCDSLTRMALHSLFLLNAR